MERIFVVEDEAKLRTELCKVLEKNGYDCVTTEDFDDVTEAILTSGADLVLLDLNLPVHDGFFVCREIRNNSEVPIIVVTSSNSDMDELMSLNLGADDFITKPYNTHILLAHIAAVLNRAYGKKESYILSHNGLTLDVLKSKASAGDKSIELTKNELGILKTLIENHGNIVSRDEIIRQLWHMEEFVEDSTLTVNVNRLRKKLADLGMAEYLVTKRGQGYMV
ncbi:Glycopeptide resistance-associated protein R [uncultured Eubacterium sp.]|nr:Glycopeptide resistance-associated protein R [uncultured Eubacterium sp.]